MSNKISLSAGDKNKGLTTKMFIILTEQQLAKISVGGKNMGLKARMFIILTEIKKTSLNDSMIGKEIKQYY